MAQQRLCILSLCTRPNQHALHAFWGAGETLTGTQKHGHIVHPMQKSCEPTVPTRDNRGPSLMDLDPSLLIGCRASTALHLRQKHCLVV